VEGENGITVTEGVIEANKSWDQKERRQLYQRFSGADYEVCML